jgi:sulfonate transport system permease protein
MTEMQPRPVSFRGGGFVLQPRWPATIVFFAVVLVLWEMASRTGWVSTLALPPLSAVGEALMELIHSQSFWRNVTDSLFRIVVGWSLGTVCGLAAGAAMGIWSLPRAIGVPAVAALFPIPKIALLPLLILWLGIGEQMKVLTIALGVFVPIYLQTHAGLRAIEARYVELAQTVRLARVAFLRRVIIPGALPGFLLGLRFAVTGAWLALVVVEQINSTSGIGYMMELARTYGQTDVIVVGLVLYGLLGLVSDGAVRLLQRKALSWQVTLAD